MVLYVNIAGTPPNTDERLLGRDVTDLNVLTQWQYYCDHTHCNAKLKWGCVGVSVNGQQKLQYDIFQRICQLLLK